MPYLIQGVFVLKKEGQQIREIGPTWHAKKAGTPTMGGILLRGINSIAIAVVGIFNMTINQHYVGIVIFIGGIWPYRNVG